MHQRTELVYVLRSTVYQQGLTFPNGFENVALIEAALQDPNTQISDVVRLECLDLITRIARLAEKTARIKAKIETATELAKDAYTARRLQTMPGVGPVTALAAFRKPGRPTYGAC